MKVTVCRVWDRGEVTAFCSDQVVGAEMELDSFLHVLLYEAGILDPKIVQAIIGTAPRVLSRMKQETAKVVL